jgi:S1-C subfamily serine protease
MGNEMTKQTIAALLIVLVGCSTSQGADAPLPATASPAAQETLIERYVRLNCAVVRIHSEHDEGTGFFIDSDGSLVTAAHVVFDKSFSKTSGNASVVLTPKRGLQMFLSSGQALPLQIAQATSEDQRYGEFDLALVKTHVPSSCFVPLRNASAEHFADVGEHLIAIGYPGSGWQHQVLYDGFLSSIYPQPVQMGVADGRAVVAVYPIFRVQMPITAGASGAPLITDSGDVIGVVTATPVPYSDDVSETIKAYVNDPLAKYPNPTRKLRKVLGELAFAEMEFLSPGSGVAVSTLVLTPSPVPPSQTSATATGAATPPQR